MKYVDEFRDPKLIRQAAAEIRRLVVPGARPGDILLVHMGVAIGRVEDTP